jgi:hypothetical protein
VVAGVDIEFGKSSTPFPLIDKLIDEREGIGVLDCNTVEFVVIDDHASLSVFFGDKKKWGCKRRF